MRSPSSRLFRLWQETVRLWKILRMRRLLPSSPLINRDGASTTCWSTSNGTLACHIFGFSWDAHLGAASIVLWLSVCVCMSLFPSAAYFGEVSSFAFPQYFFEDFPGFFVIFVRGVTGAFEKINDHVPDLVARSRVA